MATKKTTKFEKMMVALAVFGLALRIFTGAVTTEAMESESRLIANKEWTNGSETVYISPCLILMSETGSSIQWLSVADSGTGEVVFNSDCRSDWVYKDGYLYHNGLTWWETDTGLTSSVGYGSGTAHYSDSEVFITFIDTNTAAVGNKANSNPYYYYETNWVEWDGKLALFNSGDYNTMILFHNDGSAICNVTSINSQTVSLGRHYLGCEVY